MLPRFSVRAGAATLPNTRMLEIYQSVYLWALVFFSLLAFPALISSLTKAAVYPVIYWGSLLCIAWTSYSFLKKKYTRAFPASFISAFFILIVFSYRLFVRLMFLAEHNGRMELPDGTGSPLAFMIGMFFEIYFFLPFFVITLSGIIVLCYQQKVKR